ncbi:DUF317 domain-containing protein [Streptomyces shenzhenensis]|uniref:DUF317 domain-containing protein n=1 Tax=Streptomyces shenzhenensis TaxID=943815 RepID=UPI0034042A14
MPIPLLDGDVRVSPIYLAGPTFTGDPALEPLLDIGFTMHHDDIGNVFVSSCRQDIRLGYLPEGPDLTYWKVTAQQDPFGPPDWMATFEASTPPNWSPTSRPPSPLSTRKTPPVGSSAPSARPPRLFNPCGTRAGSMKASPVRSN